MTSRDVDLRFKPPTGMVVKQDADGFEIIATARSASPRILAAFSVVWLVFGLIALLSDSRELAIFATFVCLLSGIPLAAYLVGSLFGKAIVGRRGAEGWVTHGSGFLGHMERFSWQEIETVEAGFQDIYAVDSETPQRVPMIILKGADRQVIFGGELSAERRTFIVRILNDFCRPR
jgi:hypothetical protein